MSFAWLGLSLVACTPTAELQLADPDAVTVVFALLDAEGGVRALDAQPAQALVPFTVALDARYPVVSFSLRTEDFMRFDGAAVTKEQLQQVAVRRSLAPAPADRGACGRCLEPPSGALQVVHSGDACPPLLSSGRVFTGQGGLLRPVVPGELDAQAQDLLRSVSEQIRLDWPGPCAFGQDEPPAQAPPQFVPISPSADPWPVWAVAQDASGALGLFTEGVQTVTLASGLRLQTEAEPTSGRPISAVSLPRGAQDGLRFLVAFDHSATGQPEQTDYRLFEVRQGQLTSGPALLGGISSPEGFQAVFMAWRPVTDRSRLVLAGSRGSRPALALCDAASEGISCEEVTFEDPACSEVGPVRDLIVTPRGWFAVAERAFMQAASEVTGPGRWRCHDPGTQRIKVRDDDDPIVAQPILRSVGQIASRLLVCGEPVGWGDRAYLLESDLEGSRPFDGTPLNFSLDPGADYEGVRCGEFSTPSDLLGSPAPDRVRLDLMSTLLDVSAEGAREFVNFNEYWAESLGYPWTRLVQRAPGWLVQHTGWAVEPRALGGAILTRSATTGWTKVRGEPAGSALIEVVARKDDYVAFNAFTDGLPLRIQLAADPQDTQAELQEVAQLPSSRWFKDVREGVEAALFDAANGQTYVIGNRHVASDGTIQDGVDLAWQPFLRRFSPELDAADDVPLALSPGHFLCDGAQLEDGAFVLVGGLGTLLLFDGQQVRKLSVDYDDPATEAVEVAPFAVNTGDPQPHFLAVHVSEGVAWVAGDRGLVVRVARERVGGSVDWVARRVALSRVEPAGLRTPLAESARFTHVQALAPDHAVFVAQRRPVHVNIGCARPRRQRTLTDRADIVEVGPARSPQADWPLVWRTWPHNALHGDLPELALGGFMAGPAGLMRIEWQGLARGGSGQTRALPFFPVAVTQGAGGRIVMVGPNLRVAVSKGTSP